MAEAVRAALFETPRLYARALDEGDLQEMLTVYGDQEAMVWVGDGDVLSPDEAVAWIAKTQNNYQVRGYGMTAIVLHKTHEVVGFCGLVHPDGQPEVEIKYAFKRAFWGQGLATETVVAMVAYGVRCFDMAYIMATTAPENAASHRVLLKSGFQWGPLVDDPDGSKTQVLEWHRRQS